MPDSHTSSYGYVLAFEVYSFYPIDQVQKAFDIGTRGTVRDDLENTVLRHNEGKAKPVFDLAPSRGNV